MCNWTSAIRITFVYGMFAACFNTPSTLANEPLMDQLAAAVPRQADQFRDPQTQAVKQAANQLVATVAARPSISQLGASQAVAQIAALVALKSRVDRLLDETLARRAMFVTQSAGPERREAMRNYLRATSTLIDLSGRLRYRLFDILTQAVSRLADSPRHFEALLDGLIAQKSSIGASVLADQLFAQPTRITRQGRARELATKGRLLKLIAVARQSDLLSDLTDFVLDPATPASLVVQAAETIRAVGLPQPPRPQQDAELPEPEILPAELRDRLQALDPKRLSADEQRRRAQLLAWLATRVEQGVGKVYRVGRCDLQPGDWLLMRNPSPYNLFTDLAPGLFTHVGVVTVERGSDGLRRMVVVDLPERGAVMQTTNVDLFVRRTLHYMFLRHQQPDVGQAMGLAARQVIGNPTRFDLNFRTDRVEPLRDAPLAGQTIHTYCAGLLLICAQRSAAPRTDFFPIAEYPAGGHTVENLAQLGLSFGKNFVSPTGALFSDKLQIVGRRHSMYDPRREIEEAIYDHFAQRLAERHLTPSPDLFQSLRQKLVEAARDNRLLARAIANAAGVSEQTDLVSAAKAAAVVETLDEVARANSEAFGHARHAVRAASEAVLADDGYDAESVAAIRAYQARHAQLRQQWLARTLSPRALRLALVAYYRDKGRRQLDARFFATQNDSISSP